MTTTPEAEATLQAVASAFKPWVEAGHGSPTLKDEDGTPVISWENGPFDWPFLFPHGGVEEEFGFTIPDVSDMLPEGVHCEARNGYEVAIYEEVTR